MTDHTDVRPYSTRKWTVTARGRIGRLLLVNLKSTFSFRRHFQIGSVFHIHSITAYQGEPAQETALHIITILKRYANEPFAAGMRSRDIFGRLRLRLRLRGSITAPAPAPAPSKTVRRLRLRLRLRAKCTGSGSDNRVIT